MNTDASIQIADTEFTVVDVETTGLHPRRGDRIIEIAAIRIDGHGNTLNEFTTLLNPDRDLGPVHIHGIWVKDLENAPRFEEIAGDILRQLGGAVLVAHNLPFDRSFVRSEFSRIGYDLPRIPSLCTMRLAKALKPRLDSQSLESCCDQFGITLNNAHNAYHDAVATTELLKECLRLLTDSGYNFLADIGINGRMIPYELLPQLSSSGRFVSRSHTTDPCVSEMKPQESPFDTSTGIDLLSLKEQLHGKRICFTGEFQSRINGQRISRSMAIGLAEEKGIFVSESLTKKNDFLIVADPDSMSRKAKTARKFGIKIMSEEMFFKLIGVNCE
jgi:DNA polymerase III subunit epsilon